MAGGGAEPRTQRVGSKPKAKTQTLNDFLSFCRGFHILKAAMSKGKNSLAQHADFQGVCF
jgi:hypothetical protein